jgi:hypothetical protein
VVRLRLLANSGTIRRRGPIEAEEAVTALLTCMSFRDSSEAPLIAASMLHEVNIAAATAVERLMFGDLDPNHSVYVVNDWKKPIESVHVGTTPPALKRAARVCVAPGPAVVNLAEAGGWSDAGEAASFARRILAGFAPPRRPRNR